MADLRSAAVDFKRDNTSKAKWAHGESYGPGRSKDGHAAPARQKPRFPKSNHELGTDRNAKNARRADILTEAANASSSDSDDLDEPLEPSAAPDADIAYSFDAHKGPTHGSAILSDALKQAVERFENKVTEKLVKEEYDVLPANAEELLTPVKKSGKGKKGTIVEAEEDDYEFV